MRGPRAVFPPLNLLVVPSLFEQTERMSTPRSTALSTMLCAMDPESLDSDAESTASSDAELLENLYSVERLNQDQMSHSLR